MLFSASIRILADEEEHRILFKGLLKERQQP